MISIRELNQGDLPRLTEIAARGCDHDRLDAALVAEKTVSASDFRSALGLVAFADGSGGGGDGVAGFCQGALGQEPGNRQAGYVRLMVVDRPWRRRGVGSALLRAMEHRLASLGATSVAIYDCPHNYLTPGVDFRETGAFGFLHRHGYVTQRANHNMVADLDANAWPELDDAAVRLRAAGLTVRRAVAEDGRSVQAFLALHWPPWRHEVGVALRNLPATLWIALCGQEVIAFSAYQGNNRSLPWFGPMGTDPALRGRGVGALLLRLCLRDLARQGHSHAIIPWVGPVGFYAGNCGARMDRCFYAWRKDLVAAPA